MDIKDRKADHVRLSITGTANYDKTTGFEHFDFIHNALPEVNFDEIDTGAALLGRSFPFPLFISSMTGGTTEAGAINEILAEFCEDHDLPLGVGSQRIMLENPSLSSTFSIVREKAPNVFLASNIGGCQLIGRLSASMLRGLVDTIRADAVIVHLNPLQELIQPEGDRSFKGILNGIGQLVKDAGIPVIVKETGAGISHDTARKLVDAGVSVIDVAGAGGTSWAKVENRRQNSDTNSDIFDNWGIPTAECLLQFLEDSQRGHYDLIASGGIRNSLDMLKALCLGADFTATAQPVIQAVVTDGREGLERLYDNWSIHFRTGMCLLGCGKVSDLGPHLLRRQSEYL